MLFHEIVFWAACKTEKLELVKQLYEDEIWSGSIDISLATADSKYDRDQKPLSLVFLSEDRSYSVLVLSVFAGVILPEILRGARHCFGFIEDGLFDQIGILET